MDVANIRADIPSALPEELTGLLVDSSDVRIERIVSYGHKSAPDFWYNQSEHEWVMVLEGSAVLVFESGEQVKLQSGDFINIPKNVRHRIESTKSNTYTIWLAVFYKA